MMAQEKREPSAEQIAAANGLREMFEAMLIAGFTEAQALAILGYTLGTMFAGNQGERG